MNIRRYYVPNAIVFITQVVEGRQPIFVHDTHIDLLRTTIRDAKTRYPFQMLAYALLPDHFHLLIRAIGSVTHSQIMHSIKPNFTKAYKQSIGVEGPMKFWQRRYWDRVVRDENELVQRMDYIHYNPVKHGYVFRPEEWAHSSFRDWQQRGAYPAKWGWSLPGNLPNSDAP